MKAGELLGQRPRGPAHQQVQPPGRARVEVGVLVDHEDVAFAECGGSVDGQTRQAALVAVMEADRGVALDQLDTIEDAAAHVARPLVGKAAIGEQGNGVFAGGEARHQLVVAALAEQIAANARRIEVAQVKIDEGGVAGRTLAAQVVLRRGADEGVVDLSLAQGQVTQCPLVEQALPVGGRVDLVAHAGDWRCRGVLDQPQGGGDQASCPHDGVVDHDDGHGGAGDGIDVLSHLQARRHRGTQVLAGEVVQAL